MIKFKEILKAIKDAPKDFPVETAMGLTFWVATMLNTEGVIKIFYPLMFIFVIFVVAITLHKINKLAYYASYLLIWVAYFVIKDGNVLEQPWFWVLNIIAAIVLVADLSKSDNRSFANTVIFRLVQIASAALLSGILSLMLSAIIASIIYLFDAYFGHLLLHVNTFIFIVVMPLIYCNFQAHGEEGDSYDNSLVRIIVDYIVSPALVIYTVVLALYILKILIAFELPRGGVAYMVSIFIALALVCNLLNKLVKNSHFDWFYNNFAYIAIAPIVLLWIGTIYRIQHYGLTEWRVYLLLVNILMTVFPLMLKIPRTSRYNLLTVVLMAVMVLFTCLPPISAQSIGVRNQYSRFLSHAKELEVFDTKNWTLRNDIDIERIRLDSTLAAKYRMMRSEYNYLYRNCDSIHKNEELHGWAYWHSIPEVDVNPVESVSEYWYTLEEHVDEVSLDGFNRLYLDSVDASYDAEKGVLTVTHNKKTIIEYHIQDTLQAAGKDFYDNPLRVLKYHNDSALVIINELRGKDQDGVFVLGDLYSERLNVFGK